MELGKLNNLAVVICFTLLVSISSSLRVRHRVGDTCDSNLACDSIQGSVKCETTLLIPLCLCNKGFISNEARNNCLPIRQEEGQLCWSNLQCSSGLGRLSRCERGHCECFDSTSNEGKSKLVRYDPETKKCSYWNEQTNSEDEDTSSTSEETESTTSTTPRWPPVLPPPLIGESCKSTEHCKEVINGPVQCKDLDASKICQCDEGYTENESRNECVKIENPGSTENSATTAESDTTENHATYLIVSEAVIVLSLFASFNCNFLF